MSMADISHRILAAAVLVALLIATTPALALALAPQDSPNAMDCCKDGLCPMHQHKSGDEPLCGPNGDSPAPQYTVRACDSTAHFALGIAPFILIVPTTISVVAPMLTVPVVAADIAPTIVKSPGTPPPRIILN